MTTVRLPAELLEELDALSRMLGTERSEVIREALRYGVKELRLRVALELYSKGKVSLGRAAEIAGITVWELYEELRRRGITIRYGLDRFKEEISEVLES